MPLAVAVSSALAVGFLPVLAGGATGGYFLSGGLEYTTNIELVPENERGELIYLARAGISYEESSRHLDYRVSATGEFRHFNDGTYDDELFGLGTVAAIWKPYPERFHWIVEDALAPVVDPGEKLTPNNIRNTNFFSTGPDVFLRLNPVNTINIGGRVGDVRAEAAEDGNIDNTFVSGYARWLYQLSTSTTLSLNHERRDVDYKDEGNQDFGQKTNFAGYSYRSTLDQFTLNAGRSEIDRDGGDTARSGVGSIGWNRTITPRTAFFFRAAQELSDATTDIVSQVTNNPQPGVVGTAISTDVFLSRSAVARYSFGRGVTGATSGVQVFWNKRMYEIEVGNNEEDAGGRIDILVPFTTTLLGVINGSYVKRDFFRIERIDREASGGFQLNYQITRRVSVGGLIRYTESSSSDPAFNYDEGRIGVFVTYSTLASVQQ